jgi:hypothetical protein
MKWASIKPKEKEITIEVNGNPEKFYIKPLTSENIGDVDITGLTRDKDGKLSDKKQTIPLITKIMSRLIQNSEREFPTEQNLMDLDLKTWAQLASNIEWPEGMENIDFFRISKRGHTPIK